MYIFEIFYHSRFQLYLNFSFIYVFFLKLTLMDIYFALFDNSEINNSKIILELAIA